MNLFLILYKMSGNIYEIRKLEIKKRQIYQNCPYTQQIYQKFQRIFFSLFLSSIFWQEKPVFILIFSF
jgi:hypothetical protein